MNDNSTSRRRGIAALLLIGAFSLLYVISSGIYALTAPVGTTRAAVVPVTATPDQ